MTSLKKYPKFRVYHKEHGMFYEGDFRLKYNRDGRWYMLIPSIAIGSFSPKDWVLMEYIRLEDSKGKEIYEDDLIQLYYNYGDKRDREVVGKPFRVERSKDATGFVPFTDGCGGCGSYYMRAIDVMRGYRNKEYGWYEIEVVGNAHEEEGNDKV